MGEGYVGLGMRLAVEYLLHSVVLPKVQIGHNQQVVYQQALAAGSIT